jgi:hypothetical protein
MVRGTVSTSYSLSVSSSGVDSGIDDVATGQSVLLTLNGSGVVEGRTAISGDLVFTVSVNGSGTVTLDQLRAVVHPDASNPDDAVSLSSANLISLTRSSTITDRDGDSASDSASINIGQSLSFEDDGPSIDVTVSQSADALVVDETVLATNATANYADNFGATSSFGADGAGTVSTSYSLSVSSSGVDSGIDDVATGQSVLLTLNGSGVVEGRTAISGDLVFTVSVNGSGTVTLDQLRAVVHPDASNPDDAVSLSSANLISLTRSSTITDRDGDSASDSASINIGQSLSFEDDGPSIDVTVSQSADALVVDETVLATNATANYADNFGATSSFGADGAGTVSTSYSLSVSSSGVDSGIDDVATGQSVLLTLNGSGVVEGRTAISGDLVFTVSVNGSGTVTLDQLRAVVHPDASNPDDAVSLSSANLISLTRSSTITDRDGDSASDSASINIGQSLSFEDDGPSIDVTVSQSADALVVDETVLATNATANYADNFGATSSFGADGAGTVSTSYSLSVSSSGVDSGIDDVATGQSVLLTLNGSGVVEGRTAISGDLVFTVSVNGSGTVTLDQLRAVVHPDASNPDDAVSLSSANLISLTRSSTITDRDGDSASDSASINIGQSLSFEDDGPAVSIANTFVYNADGSSNTGAQAFNFGADGQASTGNLTLTSTGGLPAGYNLVKTGADTWTAVLGTTRRFRSCYRPLYGSHESFAGYLHVYAAQW